MISNFSLIGVILIVKERNVCGKKKLEMLIYKLKNNYKGPDPLQSNDLDWTRQFRLKPSIGIINEFKNRLLMTCFDN